MSPPSTSPVKCVPTPGGRTTPPPSGSVTPRCTERILADVPADPRMTKKGYSNPCHGDPRELPDHQEKTNELLDRGLVSSTVVVIAIVVVVLLVLVSAVRVIKQYELGVLFRLGRVQGTRQPGLRMIIPFVDVLRRVSLRIVTMPIQSQGIITRDNVSVDVSAVAYFRVTDAVKSVVAIENVTAAIDQIAQTTLRKVVGQHTLDETLSETDRINIDIREILDVTTVDWGVEVTLVELKDIQLPDSMKRAMARQAEAEREKRAKIISAEGESLAAAA